MERREKTTQEVGGWWPPEVFGQAYEMCQAREVVPEMRFAASAPAGRRFPNLARTRIRERVGVCSCGSGSSRSRLPRIFSLPVWQCPYSPSVLNRRTVGRSPQDSRTCRKGASSCGTNAPGSSMDIQRSISREYAARLPVFGIVGDVVCRRPTLSRFRSGVGKGIASGKWVVLV